MPRRSIVFSVFLLLASAASVLACRFFLTLDGPMHVLHACAMKSAWFSHRYTTPEVDYLVNRGTMDLTDLVLVPLTTLFSPVTAHAIYVAFTLLLLGAGYLRIANTAERPNPWLLVWLLPLSLSFILILGFLTFLCAAGLALFTAGWWMGRPRITGREALIALVAILACQATHRAGGSLAVMFIGCFEGVLFVRQRDIWKERWRPIDGRIRNALLALGGAAALYKVITTLLSAPRVRPGANGDTWSGLFELRPLLLLDERAEQALLIALGILLLISVAWALVHRLRKGGTSVVADAVLLAALVLLATSILARTPNARLLYIGTRAQLIALMLLTIWAAMTIPRSRWSLLLGGLILFVHTGRAVYVERRMAGSRTALDHTLEVVERLPLHGVALPIVRDDNWLHEHLSAFAAASYEGVFFSPGDHLGFSHHQGETWQLRDYSDGFQHELRWLEEHVSTNAPPVIDHIVLLGHGKDADERVKNALTVMRRHYFLQWTNGYAEVWVLNEDR